MASELNVKPMRKHQYDACAVIGVKPTEEGLCDHEWDGIIQSGQFEYTLPSGLVLDIVRAIRKVDGPVVSLVCWFKEPSGIMSRKEVKERVREELGNLIK